jgi:hypothetical protein
MPADKVAEAAVEYFASRSHDAWRRQFLKANPDQKGKPRMRLRGGKMVDINQPWKALDAKAKADNKAAGYAAFAAIQHYPRDREKAAAFVHAQWVERNRADPSQSKALFKPYRSLPEEEKDKDRAHIDRMKAALAAVKGVKRGSEKKPSKKRLHAAKPLAVSRTAQARLEAAAAELSAALGRKVTAQALLDAGVEAVLAIYAATKPKKRVTKS